jgi:AmiR/NasT family two-component response regulator
VLLFTHDEDHAYAVSLLLGVLGWRTYPHMEAATLVEVCRAYRPDVVFLDTDDEDAPARPSDLRAACDDPDLVVVAVTAPGMRHDATWASRGEFDAVEDRPLDGRRAAALLARVRPV